MEHSDARYHYTLFEGPERLLPEVPRLGWSHFLHTTTNGLAGPRVNPHSYEIFCVTHGILKLRIRDAVREAKADEVLIVRPGEVFCGAGFSAAVEPCEIHWFELSVPGFTTAPGLAGKARAALARDLATMDRRNFPLRGETIAAFRRLVAEHSHRARYGLEAARLALHAVVIGLIRDHAAAAAGATHQGGNRMQVVFDWLLQQPAGTVTLRDMAAVSGLSLRQFYRAFEAASGTSPADYVARWRIEKAKALIGQTTEPITKVALRLGFASSQHFATVFARYAGVAPTYYRKRTLGALSAAGRPRRAGSRRRAKS